MVQGLEFEIMIPGIKSINLVAPHVEEMTEWMGAIGRSVDIAKENISSKHFVKMEADEEGYDRHRYYYDDNEYYCLDNVNIENCVEELEPNICAESIEDQNSRDHHKRPITKYKSQKKYQRYTNKDDLSESDDDHKEKKYYKRCYKMKDEVYPKKYYRIKEV
jgi:hypothetical protein